MAGHHLADDLTRGHLIALLDQRLDRFEGDEESFR